MTINKPQGESLGKSVADADTRKPGEDDTTPLDLERVEENVRANKGLGIASSDRGHDRSETEDALRRAVDRSNNKRDAS